MGGNKGRGKSGPRKTQWVPVTESALLTGIKQGAAQSVTKAFGCAAPGGQKRKTGKKRTQRLTRFGISCWDAFHESHMPLPRAVAPYTVIRTTAIWKPTGQPQIINLFGPTRDSSNERWTPIYCLGNNNSETEQLDKPSGAYNYCFESLFADSWKAASIAPAAFSIQIMNPQALQDTEGMVYIARCKNKVALSEGNLTKTWGAFAESLVSYSNPRLCSAAKLAMRGVQVDAVPNNMSELADFSTLETNGIATGSFTPAANGTIHQEGFNPIFVYNPQQIDLQILVCCEWRVRFDPSNPAYASVQTHRPSTEGNWFDTMQKTLSMGNGVIDIASKVADMGGKFAPAMAAMAA